MSSTMLDGKNGNNESNNLKYVVEQWGCCVAIGYASIKWALDTRKQSSKAANAQLGWWYVPGRDYWIKQIYNEYGFISLHYRLGTVIFKAEMS
uniref:Cysteine-rich RLK (Receptor-like protein kinase) 8 n=1 Tax=Heterorhabditis bacteriophora TaxID=37862 RepID=A0A1I7XNC0_HETBA